MKLKLMQSITSPMVMVVILKDNFPIMVEYSATVTERTIPNLNIANFWSQVHRRMEESDNVNFSHNPFIYTTLSDKENEFLFYILEEQRRRSAIVWPKIEDY